MRARNLLPLAATVVLALPGAAAADGPSTRSDPPNAPGCAPLATSPTGGPGYDAGSWVVTEAAPTVAAPSPSGGRAAALGFGSPRTTHPSGVAGPTRLRAALGEQYAGVFLDPWRNGWGVGLAPGPLDGPAARAKVEALLADDPAKGPAAAAALRIVAMPWSERRIGETFQQVQAALAGRALPLGYGVGCRTGAFGVDVTFYAQTTEAEEREVREALAPLGDRVSFERLAAGAPQPTPGVGPPSSDDRGATTTPARARLPATATRRAGTLRLRLRCPASASSACAGRVLLRRRVAGRTVALGSARFSRLAAGRVRTVVVRVPRAKRRHLRGRVSALLRGSDGATLARRSLRVR